jgi:hypothetical protein
MNFVELMRKLVERSDLIEPEKRDARKLLQELDRMNAFGTLLTMTNSAHKFTPIRIRETDTRGNPYGPWFTVCKYCGKGKH